MIMASLPALSFAPPLFLLWVVMAAAGFFLLWKILSQYFERPVTVLTFILVLFGTNLFWQIVFAPPGAHIFLFTLYLLMILLTHLWQKNMHWLPLVAMLPVMIAIAFLHAPGIFMMLFPAFEWSGDPKSLDEMNVKFRKDRVQLVFLAGMFVICLILMQFSWFNGPGEIFYYWDATAADFPVLPANIHRVLFSAQNGWLVYSPLVIFAIAGFWFQAEKSRALFLASFLFLLVSLGSAASNPAWSFPESFGYPNLIETYAVLCLPLGYLIRWGWNRNRQARIILLVLSVTVVFLNIFQTLQFRRSARVEPSSTVLTDSIPQKPWLKCSRIASFDFENGDDHDPFRLKLAARSGNYGLLLNGQHRYSPGLTSNLGQLTDRDSSWINASGYFLFTCKNASSKVFLVITCIRKGVAYKYRVTDLSAGRFHPNQWNRVTMSYLVPFPVEPDDLLQVYFMDYGEEPCFIDDIEIDLCKPTL